MRQDFSGSGILNSNRILISKFLNDNARGPILSIQNNLSSANKNFIADKISSNSQTLTEDKNISFELDKNRINKDLTASVQDQDLTYFINEQTHKTPVAVYQVPTATRVAYTGVPVHVNQTTVHTVHAAAPQKVHVPVVASPQPVHYVSVAESHPPAHVVVEQQPTSVHIVSAPPPSVTVKPVFLPQLPVVEERVIVEEVKEESAHNLVCHPDEPTYIHDVNFNLCPCNEEKAAAAPIMFAETTNEVKERGGFPWWLLLLILLGLFLIGKNLNRLRFNFCHSVMKVVGF